MGFVLWEVVADLLGTLELVLGGVEEGMGMWMLYAVGAVFDGT